MAGQVSKRLLADIAELQQPLYHESGIYYNPRDEDLYWGYACVFGPADSPYEDCPMVYRFQIPQTFPFDSPKVTFHTHDGRTRFHPNMYMDGKCCLSILGTWSGPPWASTMRLSTILVTLQSLLDNDPLRHEPGYSHGSHEEVCKQYKDAVELACIRYCLERVEEIRKEKPLPTPLDGFQTQFIARIPGMLERFVKRLTVRLEKERAEPSPVGNRIPYGMVPQIKTSDLLEWTNRLQIPR
jgi:ubiquitin-protein ligase